MITINIDGAYYDAEPGETILQVARRYGIHIPTLCYHPALKPSASCKLCAVAVPRGQTGRKIAMLACVLKVSENMTVETTGPIVKEARAAALKKLLQMAPQSRQVRELAAEYEIDDPGPPPDGCIRCRLCIQVCKEVVKAGALRMEKRKGVNFVVFDPDKCIGCGTCANICPTHAIQLSDQDNLRTLALRDKIVIKYPLERCERCGCSLTTTRFLNYIENRTAPHPHPKEDHLYCPTCAKRFSDRARSIGRRTVRLPLSES